MRRPLEGTFGQHALGFSRCGKQGTQADSHETARARMLEHEQGALAHIKPGRHGERTAGTHRE